MLVDTTAQGRRGRRDVAAHGRAAQRHRARASTARVVYEVGAQQYAPILGAHPELVDILAKLMVNRIDERRTRLDARAAARERAAIAGRIRRAFTTAGPTRNVSRR